jgi:hypothetical protein
VSLHRKVETLARDGTYFDVLWSLLASSESLLGILGGLKLAFAVLSEVNLLRLNDVVGSDVFLLHVPQVGLDAHRIVGELAKEVVAMERGLERLLL